MIQILKRGNSNNGNNVIPSIIACSENDLSELNAYYRDVPNKSRAYIIGTCKYYEYSEELNEWLLVSNVSSLTQEEITEKNAINSSILEEIKLLESNLCEVLLELQSELTITQLTVVELLGGRE